MYFINLRITSTLLKQVEMDKSYPKFQSRSYSRNNNDNYKDKSVYPIQEDFFIWMICKM